MRISDHCSICGKTCYRRGYDGEWTHYDISVNVDHGAVPKFFVKVKYAQ